MPTIEQGQTTDATPHAAFCDLDRCRSGNDPEVYPLVGLYVERCLCSR